MPSRRRLAVALGLAALAVPVASVVAAPIAQARPNLGGPMPGQSAHAYRHGAVPPRSGALSSTGPLSFGGGLAGVGVTTGSPKVYLVFYGSQWGAQGSTTVGGATYATFSGDPNGMAPRLQEFFSGLGTGGETWSGVMTQYCEGVSVGATTCSQSAPHVAYPSGGALAGVWEDTSVASPFEATPVQLVNEAERGASHFGNGSGANRDTMYFVVSPTGTHPDGFNTATGKFCAWHDFAGDSNLGTGQVLTNGDLAFTNMPYVTDMGGSCGEDFVNSGTAGLLDGVTIVGGHEYAETITDQFPMGGWSDASGYENGDKCAWISPGSTGGAEDLGLTTGSFAVQSTWANDDGSSGGCEVSHPIFSADPVTVTNPGSQTSTVGSAASLQVQASDSASGQTLTYAATGLPTGLSINSSTGLVSGTPTAAGTFSVTVTATDTTGAQGSASFTWTVNPQAGNTVKVTNPGNQTTTVGTAVSLQIQASDSGGATLSYSASGLPAGLSINTSSGLVSGTPTTTGTSSVTVTATDTTGANGSASFSWTVNPSDTVSVTNPGNQSTVVKHSVSLQIQATDSQGLPLTFSATGLPSGLRISSTGLISGTVTSVHTYSVTVTATSSSGARKTVSFTWTVTRH